MLVIKTNLAKRSGYSPKLPILMRWTEYQTLVVVAVIDIVNTEEEGGAAVCVIVEPGGAPYDPFTIFDGEDMIPMSELEEFFGRIVIESK